MACRCWLDLFLKLCVIWVSFTEGRHFYGYRFSQTGLFTALWNVYYNLFCKIILIIVWKQSLYYLMTTLNVIKIIKFINYHCFLLQFDEKQHLLCNLSWKPDRLIQSGLISPGASVTHKNDPTYPAETSAVRQGLLCVIPDGHSYSETISLESHSVIKQYGSFFSLCLSWWTQFLLFLVIFICGFPLTDTVIVSLMLAGVDEHSAPTDLQTVLVVNTFGR